MSPKCEYFSFAAAVLAAAAGCGDVEETGADAGPGGADGGGLPRLAASAPVVREGDTAGAIATFEITLSEPSEAEVTVDFSTADDSATEAGADYEPTSGTLTLPAGETSATVDVQVLGDFGSEPDERFLLSLENPSGAALETAEAAATVKDDDRGFDFNGDGFADLLVGSGSAGDSGEAYIFFGAGTHEPGGEAELLDGGDVGVVFTGELNRFGRQVAGGDVNGDGLDDAVIADSMLQSGETISEVYVFFGSADLDGAVPASSADVTINGAGTKVALLDHDGDGDDDLFIGSRGVGHLFSGGALEGELGTESATATFDANDDFVKLAPSSAGDFDGDGKPDVLWAASDTTDQEGAFLFLGGEGLSGTLGLPAADVDFQVSPGSIIVGAGDFDVNGDGLSDVVLGSPHHNTSDGSVQLFFGASAPAKNPAADVTILGELGDEIFGDSVAAAGDFDGDGFGDFVGGLPSADAPDATNGGLALIFRGGEELPADLSMFSEDLEIRAGDAGDGLSRHVAVLDFNGDGFHDLALGAPGAGDAGEIYVFLGFAGGFQSEAAVSAGEADVIISAPAGSSSFPSAL